ncbi:hypothetical protein L226DRAFT_615287 [Lentinus tigrinus ALCF2SS1-7]|uniref:Protein kinase domain-containing protein n=1 Tax=Lentinus tigrinus ALCF2SS1-6 TaxID=1328759 RepID=A0A5C2S0Q8_9APHY|nr:hypothetical protein L227DRAFT_602733 [Lentinus tigrinus ALCF2SS1-6]RPD71766.1 hypothetical protein L226DRAFT_615287 [Lentinus tigrinus ALCF2SS1-7]
MAQNQITLRYFVFRYGELGRQHLFVNVPSSATILDVIRDVIKTIGSELVRAENTVLWKPRTFLPKSDPDRLVSLLKQYDHDLSKFCDALDSEAVVSDIFGVGVRADTITTLVVEVSKPYKAVTVDAAEHADEAKDVLTKLRKGLQKLRQSGPSGTPSRNCQPNHYHEHQSGENPILDGRYGNKHTTIAPPVEDFHYAFAQFKAECHDEQTPLPEEFVRRIGELMDTVSQIKVDDELGRQANTRSLLSNILSATFGQVVNSLAALAILEEKDELGTSGDGSVQGSFSYLQHWMDQGQKRLFDACFCPSFIIAVAGSYIIICGAIFTGSVVVHRLTDYIWLANSRLNDDANAHRIARVFLALGNALVRLRDFYEQLENPGPDDVPRYFPLATAYRDGDRIVKFRYTSYLKDVAESCVTYRAVECESDQPREIVVKFVEHYGDAAHELLASHGLAPKLLYYGNIWLEGPEARGCGSRRMVVMEYIEGETAHAMLSASKERAVPDDVRDAIKRAVKLLHENKMVHGDIRLGNVIIAKPTGAEGEDTGKRVRIVDFDWAGTEGEVRYPLFLSKVIRWPAGVDDDALIRPEHDDEMLTRLD